MTQRTVMSDLIVVFPPVFDQHLSLKERREEFHVEKLVLSLPAERFNISILPRTPRLIVQSLDSKHRAPHAQLDKFLRQM